MSGVAHVVCRSFTLRESGQGCGQWAPVFVCCLTLCGCLLPWMGRFAAPFLHKWCHRAEAWDRSTHVTRGPQWSRQPSHRVLLALLGAQILGAYSRFTRLRFRWRFVSCVGPATKASRRLKSLPSSPGTASMLGNGVGPCSPEVRDTPG